MIRADHDVAVVVPVAPLVVGVVVLGAAVVGAAVVGAAVVGAAVVGAAVVGAAVVGAAVVGVAVGVGFVVVLPGLADGLAELLPDVGAVACTDVLGVTVTGTVHDTV